MVRPKSTNPCLPGATLIDHLKRFTVYNKVRQPAESGSEGDDFNSGPGSNLQLPEDGQTGEEPAIINLWQFI